MKSKEEIEQLAIKEAKKLHDKSKHDDYSIYDQLVSEDAQLIAIGYTQCQEDMASKKLDVDDIDEMALALDYIINSGGLPDSVEEFQHCLHKFYEQINKQDNEK